MNLVQSTLSTISAKNLDSKQSTLTLNGIDIPAPTPGNILHLKVELGERVSKNQILLVMEAMKMESDIKSPQTGVVQKIYVNSGDTVKTGDTLITLSE